MGSVDKINSVDIGSPTKRPFSLRIIHIWRLWMG